MNFILSVALGRVFKRETFFYPIFFLFIRNFYLPEAVMEKGSGDDFQLIGDY
jgi:hypothetical protein